MQMIFFPHVFDVFFSLSLFPPFFFNLLSLCSHEKPCAPVGIPLTTQGGLNTIPTGVRIISDHK